MARRRGLGIGGVVAIIASVFAHVALFAWIFGPTSRRECRPTCFVEWTEAVRDGCPVDSAYVCAHLTTTNMVECLAADPAARGVLYRQGVSGDFSGFAAIYTFVEKTRASHACPAERKRGR